MSAHRTRRMTAQPGRNRQRPPSTVRSDSLRHSTSSEQAQSLQPPARRGNDVEDDERLELIVMAVDVRERGTIGCAYYIAREERLFCMEEIRGGSDSLLQTREFHYNGVRYICSRIDSYNGHSANGCLNVSKGGPKPNRV